ncbi:PREDICTED: uncharacterized protein LOC108362710 [Rhagoletis zephyria]|uniref:uncharacterized protein LOC108362710 n=1 Tax=Rhagoletis zephyria TaxID=28612 RepID=UPI000811264E|nr:PREDICTED: uncharacterized protein LOC108362710 [Rhagoletis zephyria]XP_017471290.1 PREDICTED: uncharacterized protein LOC108362710 [Rhagoletis zephyria]XP_017471291.1 PREDICTED: uncharacterized protein LOC108362710 [Rhagoletis zephyria]XP_017471292.1 PREDICTED: uncharacterized protein LOC108362710 [Rhagoletis zephyria]XP_017471293.1 PREDICTED: uncharacterized protein LOC108362710 [Rhagoletis zephyria]XP_017471295.1 PREDICTED: uncharacterized protein LOC108362710 [Rhagoletis zephyria]XP_01
MRTKHFILILCCIIITTIFFIILGPAGEPNDSLKSIVTHTHQQLNKLQENLRVAEKKKLQIDPKYLALLGFTDTIYTKQAQEFNHYEIENRPKSEGKIETIEVSHLPLPNRGSQDLKDVGDSPYSPNSFRHNSRSHIATPPYNGTKVNFTIVTYVQDGQAPSAILLAQNIAMKLPDDHLLIYDLGLSEDDCRALITYCNISKCSVISYDLSLFPSHVSEQRMHAYRPIVIKDALTRSHNILFAENYIRFRGGSHDSQKLRSRVMTSGVLGWNTPTAVSTLTHPKMFDYFQTDADDFIFLRMIDLDIALFSGSPFLEKNIMLPWLKCVLTLECIDPIGAQWNGCKYNKKPLYRYSGCHAYDVSAFNIVLGLTWHLDASKYSMPMEGNNIFYKETLEKSTRILENRRLNNSETSEHPFTED